MISGACRNKAGNNPETKNAPTKSAGSLTTEPARISCNDMNEKNDDDERSKTMADQSFTTSFTVDQTPAEAFAAINNVRAWWTGEPGVEGSTDKLGDEFTYRYNPHHFSKQKVTEFIPGKKVVWLVLESQLNFVKDKSEWNGTKIIFEIAKKGGKTEVRFTHAGLNPDHECYGGCSNAWGSYIKGSLRNLITAGKGESNQKQSGQEGN